MAIQLSTGLRAAMLTDFGLERMMRFGHIRIYSGVQPVSANAEASGDLLAIVSTDGVMPQPGSTTGGLLMQMGEYGDRLVKRGNWVLKGVSTGYAGWWRFVEAGYMTQGYDANRPKIDGTVGESLQIGNLQITPQTHEVIDDFLLYFPPSEV